MVGWQEGHPSHNEPCCINPQRFFSGKDGGGGPKGGWPMLTWKKWSLSGCSSCSCCVQSWRPVNFWACAHSELYGILCHCRWFRWLLFLIMTRTSGKVTILFRWTSTDSSSPPGFSRRAWFRSSRPWCALHWRSTTTGSCQYLPLFRHCRLSPANICCSYINLCQMFLCTLIFQNLFHCYYSPWGCIKYVLFGVKVMPCLWQTPEIFSKLLHLCPACLPLSGHGKTNMFPLAVKISHTAFTRLQLFYFLRLSLMTCSHPAVKSWMVTLFLL